MFEKDLEARLSRIFGLKKVRYDAPSEAMEQEILFVQIETAHPKIKDQKELARVTGKLHVFATHEKLPYGYFAKSIDSASPEDVAPFFFFDFEENDGKFLNVAERSLSFVFLFNSQFNPAVGTMNQITVETTP